MDKIITRIKALEKMVEDLPPPGFIPNPPQMELIYGSGVLGPPGQFIRWEVIQKILDEVYGPEEQSDSQATNCVDQAFEGGQKATS